jgi:hypothetical protein
VVEWLISRRKTPPGWEVVSRWVRACAKCDAHNRPHHSRIAGGRSSYAPNKPLRVSGGCSETHLQLLHRDFVLISAIHPQPQRLPEAAAVARLPHTQATGLPLKTPKAYHHGL